MHDLPSSIGRPATGALLHAGIESLDQLAGVTEAWVLGLHGVGPKAVSILRETLAAQGKAFRPE